MRKAMLESPLNTFNGSVLSEALERDKKTGIQKNEQTANVGKLQPSITRNKRTM